MKIIGFSRIYLAHFWIIGICLITFDQLFPFIKSLAMFRENYSIINKAIHFQQYLLFATSVGPDIKLLYWGKVHRHIRDFWLSPCSTFCAVCYILVVPWENFCIYPYVQLYFWDTCKWGAACKCYRPMGLYIMQCCQVEKKKQNFQKKLKMFIKSCWHGWIPLIWDTCLSESIIFQDLLKITYF